jgi:phospholipase/carboxylesterase
MGKNWIDAGEPRGRARFAGVLVHGRGSTPEDMIDLGGRLALPGIRWVAPRAEHGSWYPERFMEPREANEPFLSDAVLACEQAMVEATEHGRIPPDRSVIVGFSQGACLATEFLLRHPGRCQVAVIFTGGLIGPAGTSWTPARGTLEGLSVLITGSDVDTWVPDARVKETADVLADLGADVRLRLYHGREHLVSDREISEAQEFLEQFVCTTQNM